MTEQEWLTSADSIPMLEFHAEQFGERKLRLFALACCERIRRLIRDPRLTAVLKFVRKHADSRPVERRGHSRRVWKAEAAEREATGSQYYNPISQFRQQGIGSAARAICSLLESDALTAARETVRATSSAVECECIAQHGLSALRDQTDAASTAERRSQADLLRDIFGNPYHPVTLAPEWRTETVVALATGIYAEVAFDRLPILADALEEAGCGQLEVLSHCRDSKLLHVKGCWVIDLVLSKS